MRTVILQKLKVDPDVQAEADNINLRLSTQHTNDKIVIRSLSKKYDNHLAVNQISVGVKAAECFGLFGTNGAGKTSVFKMLTGDENINDGGNFSIKKNTNESHKKVGYCPQFDALIDDLTG